MLMKNLHNMQPGIYKFSVKKLHFEPTSACNARCPQCPRTFNTSFNTNPFLKIEEWSATDLDTVLSNAFFKDINNILINGNYGDIVMHTDPRSIIEVFVKRGYFVDINTNGSAQSLDFWKWLGQQPNIMVRFGIDGLHDTHSLYRRNTNFFRVIQNAQAYISEGGNARWVMTLFKHNAHQITDCEKLAKELGFSQFYSRESIRFSAKKLSISDKDFNHEYYLEPYNINNQIITKEVERAGKNWYEEHSDKDLLTTIEHPVISYDDEVSCMSQHEDSVFLSYDKRIWPCCHTAIGFEQTYKQYMMHDTLVDIFQENLNKDFNFNNVLKHPIDEIINTFGIFKKIEESWNTKSVCTSCIKNCKFDSHQYRQYQTTISKNISEK